MHSKKNKFGGKNWRCVIGLTGGVGTGKTTALIELKKLGAFVIDSDILVRSLLKRKTVKKVLQKKISSKIFRNHRNVDRRILGEIIFSSRRKRKLLEKIIHPMVAESIRKTLHTKKGDVAVCEVPLLFEVGWDKMFDYSLVIGARKRILLERLKLKGLNPIEINKKMEAQWPLSKKEKKGDFVIQNTGSKNDFKIQIKKLWNRIKKISINN